MSVSAKTWRVATIGAGAVIQRGHIPAFQRLPNVQVVAVCDISLERAQAAAAQAGVSGVYSDYRQMLREAAPDLVVIATPNAYHHSMTLDALDAGCHVLTEKPLATTYADAQAMVARANQVDRLLTAGTHYRWTTAMAACRAHVDAGFFGEIYAVRTVYSRRAGIPGFGSWFTNKDLGGGGSLFDIGVHALDKALFLMDYPQPITVTGVTEARLGPQGKGLGGWGSDIQRPGAGVRFDVEDFAQAFVRFANGASLQLQAAWATHMPESNLVEVYGTLGGAHVQGADGLTLYSELNGQLVTLTPELPKDTVSSSAKQAADLIRRLDGDPSADLVTDDQMLVGMQILESIYLSAASGREVVLASGQAG